jgi:hypothetical protein
MAININTVYQKVLAIANKEKRGYITPLEFNLLANQAQLDIFNQYFYDVGQFNRLPKSEEQYLNAIDIVKQKISVFEKFRGAPSAVSSNTITLHVDAFELGDVFYVDSGLYTFIEKVDQKELMDMQLSPLAVPTALRPVYVKTSSNKIDIYGVSPTTSNIKHNYIKKPIDVAWGSTIVNDVSLYNSSTSINSELHPSEETKLVVKILALSGIILEDPNLYQSASQEEMKDLQQSKA